MPTKRKLSSANTAGQETVERKKTSAVFTAPSVKRVMQAEKDVGKLQKTVPVIMSKILQMFMEDLVKKCLSQIKDETCHTLETSHIIACMEAHEKFDFLSTRAGALVMDATDKSVTPPTKAHAHRKLCVNVAAGDLPRSTQTTMASSTSGLFSSEEDDY